MEKNKLYIRRGKPETLDNNKRRGVIEVHHKKKGLVKIFLYRIKNNLSLKMAKKDAEKWINQ